MKLKLSKQVIYIAVLVLFVLLALIPLMHPMLYLSHDGENHIARFAAYDQAIREGQFPPRWAGTLNFRFGIPALIFFYPLPGYLATQIHALGLNWESTFKLLIGLADIFAPITFYYWIKQLFRSEIAFLGSLLYAFLPYHLLDLYVRGDIGEMLAFVFVPLVFLFIEKTCTNNHKQKITNNILLGGICYALLILSHNGVSLMFSPVFLIYAYLRSIDQKIFFKSLLIFFFGLTLSSFFWLPAMYEGKYVNAKLFIGDMYRQNFPNPLSLIYSPWGFGSEVNQPGGLSPQIGIIPIGLSLLSIGLFIKQKKKDKMISMWTIVLLAAIFITINISTPIWELIPLLRLYEFPWRFIGLSSFVATVLACYTLQKIKNTKIIFIYLFIVLVASVPLIHVRNYTTQPDAYYANFSGTTYYHGEASPIWTAGDASKFPKTHIEIISGKAKISAIHKTSQLHTFTILAQNNTQLLDNTVYYPGWKVFIDNQLKPIQFQDPNHRGLITFSVPSGKHHVSIKFTETIDRRLTDILSLIGWIIVGLGLIYYSRKPLL